MKVLYYAIIVKYTFINIVFPCVGSDEAKVETPSSAELGLKAYDFEDGKMVMDGTKDLISDSSGDKKKRPRKLQKLGKE